MRNRRTRSWPALVGSSLLALLIGCGAELDQPSPSAQLGQFEADPGSDDAPTCTGDPSAFPGGIHGYCQQLTSIDYLVDYYDDAGGHRSTFEYTVGAEGAPPVAGCLEVCAAGLLAVVEGAAADGAPESYPLCDSSGPTDDDFRCRGACGLGCRSCTTEIGGPCGGAGPGYDNGCREVTLRCYTRDCCWNHDFCLAACTLLSGSARRLCEAACHALAVEQGCGWRDALGWTGTKPDARPITFERCVKAVRALGEEPVPLPMPVP